MLTGWQSNPGDLMWVDAHTKMKVLWSNEERRWNEMLMYFSMNTKNQTKWGSEEDWDILW